MTSKLHQVGVLKQSAFTIKLSACAILKGETTMKEYKWFWYTKERKQENKSPRQAVSCHLHFKFTFQNQWLTQLELLGLLFSVTYHAWLETYNYKLTLTVNCADLGLNVNKILSVTALGLCESPFVSEASERDWCLQKLTADLCLHWSRFNLSARPPLFIQRQTDNAAW